MKRIIVGVTCAAIALGLWGAAAYAVTINGTSGSDCIEGSNSADVLSGFAGRDSIFGFGGNDTINGGPGNDGGTDYCVKSPGGSSGGISPGFQFRLSGGDGDDTIYGGDGDDWVMGNAGEDTLYGNDGNDRIWADGDMASDRVYGNAGYDICYVRTNDVVSGCEEIIFP